MSITMNLYYTGENGSEKPEKNTHEYLVIAGDQPSSSQSMRFSDLIPS